MRFPIHALTAELVCFFCFILWLKFPQRGRLSKIWPISRYDLECYIEVCMKKIRFFSFFQINNCYSPVIAGSWWKIFCDISECQATCLQHRHAVALLTAEQQFVSTGCGLVILTISAHTVHRNAGIWILAHQEPSQVRFDKGDVVVCWIETYNR